MGVFQQILEDYTEGKISGLELRNRYREIEAAETPLDRATFYMDPELVARRRFSLNVDMYQPEEEARQQNIRAGFDYEIGEEEFKRAAIGFLSDIRTGGPMTLPNIPSESD